MTGLSRCGNTADQCRRCGSPVAKPGETYVKEWAGIPTASARYCAGCIDRCHESTDFAHVCQICATPEESARYGWEPNPGLPGSHWVAP